MDFMMCGNAEVIRLRDIHATKEHYKHLSYRRSAPPIVRCGNTTIDNVYNAKPYHLILFHPETHKHVTVPVGKKDCPIGTAKAIFRSAGIEA
jgi:hypothetical protein